MKDHIIIKDWANNILFEGHIDDAEVDRILDANRCSCRDNIPYEDCCNLCDNTGYICEFEVFWQDENREDNVYEFINY